MPGLKDKNRDIQYRKVIIKKPCSLQMLADVCYEIHREQVKREKKIMREYAKLATHIPNGPRFSNIHI